MKKKVTLPPFLKTYCKTFSSYFLYLQCILMTVSLIAMIVISIIVINGNRKIYVFEQNSIASYSSRKCYVSMLINTRSDGTQNSWQNPAEDMWGAQYDIFINNNSPDTFEKWSIEMSVPKKNRIDSNWNGIFIKKFGVIEIKPSIEMFNASIGKYSSQKLGLVLYTPALLKNCDFVLRGQFRKSVVKNQLFLLAAGIFSVGLLSFFVSAFIMRLLGAQQRQSDYVIDSLVKLVAGFIDVRDTYTKEHSFHVAEYSRKIAKKMNFDDEFVKNIYYLGLLHDIGKVLIPNELLCKKEKLEKKEWQIMKKHTIYGAEVLKNFTGIPDAKDAALYHHEHWDGSGYMQGLSGTDIPVVARIIGVADAYDAMATNRSYRAALPRDVILREIEKKAGSQFDPEIAAVMLELLREGKL